MSINIKVQAALRQAENYPLPDLQIKALGHFGAFQSNAVIAEERWTSLHAQIILIYLVLNGAATRDELIELVWADEAVDKTSVRLRTTLKLLRQTLRPRWKINAEYICFQNGRYRIAPGVSVASDVQQFRQALAQARQTSGLASYTLCLQALSSYGGDFLAGCFNEWVLEQREQLHNDYLRAHERCASVCLAEARYPEAEHHARQSIRSDPLREQAWQILIQSLNHMGRMPEAIEAQQQLAEHLHTLLGIAPTWA